MCKQLRKKDTFVGMKLRNRHTGRVDSIQAVKNGGEEIWVGNVGYDSTVADIQHRKYRSAMDWLNAHWIAV